MKFYVIIRLVTCTLLETVAIYLVLVIMTIFARFTCEIQHQNLVSNICSSCSRQQVLGLCQKASSSPALGLGNYVDTQGVCLSPSGLFP